MLQHCDQIFTHVHLGLISMCNYNIYMCYDGFQLHLHMYNCYNYNVQIYQLKFHLQFQNYTVRITQSELTYKYNYNVTKSDIEVQLH